MKPQFTEEEARQMCKDCGFDEELFVGRMIEENYVRKSDLEILIEEAGRYFEKRDMSDPLDLNIVAMKQNECIQAMKAKLNKMREV